MDSQTKQKMEEVGSPTVCPAAFVFRGGKLLVGFRHYTSDKFKKIDLWTVPGGRCEPGETVGSTLLRETEEEVGISDFSVEAYLGDVDGAKEGDVVPVFVCRTEEDFRLMEPEKFSEWRWVDMDDVPRPFINVRALELVAQYLEG
jgi:8-oxo-dGTP pyrophosphatase MutT (NUDIX family)